MGVNESWTKALGVEQLAKNNRSLGRILSKEKMKRRDGEGDF